MRSAIAVHLAEQVYIAGQILRCVLHLILQLLGLRIAQSFGETAPYRLNVDGWVVGSNHRKNMSSDGHNGIAVEDLEVLPRRFAPLDDGVRTLPPAIELSSHFQVDAVKHWLNCNNYSVEVLPLGLGLLH